MDETQAVTVRDAETVQPVRVDTLTGEAIEDFRGYAGVATVALTPEQAVELGLALPDEAHEILPTGEVYVSQVHYRRLLNKVFGPGGWALVPRGPYAMQGNTITREYALVGPGGRFISEAIGESDYQPNNARMSYASACEACKSNALTRCCKDLGIASECWDKRFCERWIKDHAVKVWRAEARRRDGKTGEFQWRRKDAQPFWDEKGADKKAPTDKPAEREPGDDAPSPAAKPGSGCPHCGAAEIVSDGEDWMRCKSCRKGWRKVLVA